MSFILDALKKSEAERNRNSGPTLLEFRPARPRPRLPWWAIVIAVALLANLGVLAYALLRSPPQVAVTLPAAAAPVAPSAAPAATGPAPQAALPPAATSPVAPTADAAGTTSYPGAAAPAGPGAMTAGGGVLPDPALARTPLPPPGIDPDDLPAVAPRSPPPSARPAAGSELGLPTMADLTGAGVRLPELRLALHAWDPVPASRYVLLNGTRMREGEVTPDGLKVEQVTESGVVLEWRGRRFTLRPGE
jgi:general secretion pathway protein B